MGDSERTVHVIRRREGQQLRAVMSRFHGVLYVSLRAYFRDGAGAWRPTQKGFTIAAERLHELEAAIAALRKAVDAEPTRRPDRYERYAQLRRRQAGR